MHDFELFLRRWVTTFILLPTAAFVGNWAAFAGMVCLSALSDLIASRYMPMVPIQIFGDGAGAQDRYAPFTPDRATTPPWYWPAIATFTLGWIGCLLILRSPGGSTTGHIAFWCVYVLVPPLTAYTTRTAARILSKRRSRDAAFDVKDINAMSVHTAPVALLRHRIGMPSSGLPLIAASSMLGVLFGGMTVALIQSPEHPSGAVQLLWLYPASLIMLIMAGAALVRLPEHLYLSSRG